VLLSDSQIPLIVYIKITMSLSKLLAGRKRVSRVWKWLVYSEQKDKSVCQAAVDVDGTKKCFTALAGKNPTNLKVGHFFMPVLYC